MAQRHAISLPSSWPRFDYFYGFCSGHWGHYYDALMERNGELVKGRGFV